MSAKRDSMVGVDESMFDQVKVTSPLLDLSQIDDAYKGTKHNSSRKSQSQEEPSEPVCQQTQITPMVERVTTSNNTKF